MDDYKKLTKAIKRKYIFKKRETIDDFKDVNKCIEEISNNEIEKVKSLICQFEGNLNQANHYSVMAVFYAVIIGGISVQSNMISSFVDLNDYVNARINLSMFMVLFCFIAILGLEIFCIARMTYARDYKKIFILKALYFKLEELNNKMESSAEKSKTEEINSKNEINTASKAVETKNYREYVVRVYDK